MLYETRPTTKLYKINGQTIDSHEPIVGIKVITDSKEAVDTIDPSADAELVNILQSHSKSALMLGEKPLKKCSSFKYKSGDYCHVYLPKEERKAIACPGF